MAEGRRTNDAAALPTDALKDAGRRLLGLLVQRSAEAATQRVTGLTVRLSDVTESGGDFRAALRDELRPRSRPTVNGAQLRPTASNGPRSLE